jgi:hypothetical protein
MVKISGGALTVEKTLQKSALSKIIDLTKNHSLGALEKS